MSEPSSLFRALLCSVVAYLAIQPALNPALSVAALWRTYPPHSNTALLTNSHKTPILDLQFSALHPLLYTASTDGTVGLTDLTTGVRERRYLAHDGVVNSIDRNRQGGRELLISGGDDGVVRVWDGDVESKHAVMEFGDGSVPTTAVAWSADGAQAFVGGIDNEIHVRNRHFPFSFRHAGWTRVSG